MPKATMREPRSWNKLQISLNTEDNWLLALSISSKRIGKTNIYITNWTSYREWWRMFTTLPPKEELMFPKSFLLPILSMLIEDSLKISKISWPFDLNSNYLRLKAKCKKLEEQMSKFFESNNGKKLKLWRLPRTAGKSRINMRHWELRSINFKGKNISMKLITLSFNSSCPSTIPNGNNLSIKLVFSLKRLATLGQRKEKKGKGKKG
jgi:hypothetical protein